MSNFGFAQSFEQFWNAHLQQVEPPVKLLKSSPLVNSL